LFNTAAEQQQAPGRARLSELRHERDLWINLPLRVLSGHALRWHTLRAMVLPSSNHDSDTSDRSLAFAVGLVVMFIIAGFGWFATSQAPPRNDAPGWWVQRSLDQMQAIGHQTGLSKAMVGCRATAKGRTIVACHVLSPDGDSVARALAQTGWTDGGTRVYGTWRNETGWTREFTKDSDTVLIRCGDAVRDGGCTISLLASSLHGKASRD